MTTTGPGLCDPEDLDRTYGCSTCGGDDDTLCECAKARDAAMLREALVADLVGDVRGQIAGRRDPCYGALQISDDQVVELAAAIVQNFVGNYDVRGRLR